MIKNWPRAIGYGVLIWLIPFLMAFATLSVKNSWRSLFESIMAVTLTFTVVVCANWYFRRFAPRSLGDGVALGLLWMAISVAIDLPLMLGPPINYSLEEYAADIGLTYLLIPIVTAGVARASSAGK